jgi:hypothetical protein
VAISTNIAVRCTWKSFDVASVCKYCGALHLKLLGIACFYKYHGALHLFALILSAWQAQSAERLVEHSTVSRMLRCSAP